MAPPPNNVSRTPPMAVVAGFLGAHVVLAAIMRAVPAVATAHAIACLIFGVVIAATRPLTYVTLAIAYITGSEVLWRMTHAGVFWEFGKYAISAIAAIALLRMRPSRNRALAFGYLTLLLPSAILTLGALDFENARQQISFNLSGPLSLTFCVVLFSNVRLTGDDVRRTFVAVLGPVLAIAALAYFSTVTAQELEFARASNADTSGGFGPNQVSAMLGMGLLFCLLLLFERRMVWRQRVALLAISVALAVQAALTFSRGGLALAFAAIFAASAYLARERRVRVTIIVLGALLFSVGKYVVVPRLDAFTAGKFTERYTSADPSGRGLLASYDLQILGDHPLLGVGPGVATQMRGDLGHLGAAHTEFTRMLAEHGSLGALAIVLLVVLATRTFRGARTLEARAFVVAMLAWVTLFLLINAMRIAAPSFLMGLACAISYSSVPRVKPA